MALLAQFRAESIPGHQTVKREPLVLSSGCLSQDASTKQRDWPEDLVRYWTSTRLGITKHKPKPSGRCSLKGSFKL